MGKARERFAFPPACELRAVSDGVVDFMNAYPEVSCTVQPFEPAPAALYTIDAAAHLSGNSRHDVLLYCKHGLVSPYIDEDSGCWYFDAQSIQVLRRIEYLRGECGINFTGVQIILDLMREVERLRGAPVV